MPCESGSSPRNPDSGLVRLAQELTNLLTAVSAATELLSEQVPPGHPSRPELERLRSAVAQGDALAGSLRACGGPVPPAAPAAVLEDVVAAATETLAMFVGKDVDIVRVPSDDRSSVRIEAGMLERIIIHLGVYTRLAMPGRGTITLETSKTTPAGGSARFAILSMSATSAEQDIEARALKVARGDGGVDLATVHGMIGGIGGFVEVASDPVRGGTVTIGLPLL